MSALTNTAESILARSVFIKTTATGTVVAAATGTASFYVSLHSASPGETASGAEMAYGPYARKAVPRTATGWSVTGGTVTPAANIDFAAVTGGTTGVATHFGVWTASTGGVCWIYGAITPNITCSVGTTPRLTTSSTVTFA
jgi:hypothetical protein